VLSGEGQQMVDDQPPITVRAGASIYVPADVYHSTLNTSGSRCGCWWSMRQPAERLLRITAAVIPAGRYFTL
jgi:mannose-6-phosphate isomerase-like protein (cupin superfamily)